MLNNFLTHFKAHWASNRHQPWFRLRRVYAEIYPKWQVYKGWKAQGQLPDAWYFIRCGLWRRYNVVYIPTLPPTWTEYDSRIMHAMFTLFVHHLEHDNGRAWTPEALKAEIAKASEFDCGWYEFYLPIAEDREDLYDWWLNRRPARLEAESKALTAWHDALEAAGGVTFDAPQDGTRRMNFGHSDEEERLLEVHAQLEEAGAQEDEDMMIKLVKLLPTLWS